MITLERESLVFRFPEVHERAVCKIAFQRTLRLPDDGRTYPLPAGLGRFPLRHTDDFASRLPEAVVKRGGVVLPMWQAEAMWIVFIDCDGYPFAVKIAAGKINAVTGSAWSNGIGRNPQDYVVVSHQPWLDGFCVEKGKIRQFVAARLGEGATAEEQLTRAAVHGGLQIVVHPMKKDWYERLFSPRGDRGMGDRLRSMYDQPFATAPAGLMGLAAGGLMRQEIYEDPYDSDAWDTSVSSRCFVTILNATDWLSVTGEAPPSEPITAETYAQHGIPWFDYYAADQKALPGSSRLGGLKSIKHFAQLGRPWRVWQRKAAAPVVHLGPDVRPEQRSMQVREFDM
jgi:hypothetical protein